MATATPVAVVDALQSLLDAEKDSIFHFMSAESPYLKNADVPLRRSLDGMMRANSRRAQEVRDLIARLGGTPRVKRGAPDEAFLAFLSLKFLLPKLVGVKELCIQRHKSTLKTIADAPADVRETLGRHLADLKKELAELEGESAKVLVAR